MASFYTKDKLKAILVNHNIPIPKDAKKGVYLDLYREHVEANEHGEFSSDDEVSTILNSPTKRNKKKPGLPQKKTSTVMNGPGAYDVSALSDDDLRAQLKAHGINPGPISESTRRVYEKKLRRILEERVHSEAVHVDSPTPVPEPEPLPRAVPPAPPIKPEFSDQDESSGAEAEAAPALKVKREPRQAPLRKRPASASSASTVRQSPRRPIPVKVAPPVHRPTAVPQQQQLPQQQQQQQHQQQQHQHQHQQQEDEEEEEDEDDKDLFDATLHSSIRPYRNGPRVAAPNVTVPASPPPLTKRRRLPIMLQVVSVVLVAIAIYFIIQHLEPSAGKFLVGKLPGM